MAQAGQRKILIAVDGSEPAKRAFDWYLDNVFRPNDYVYCIHVPEYTLAGITVGPMANPDALMKQFSEKHAKVEQLCSDCTAKLREKNCQGQADSIPGEKPADVILDQAESLGIDHIIMGTRGLSRVKRVFVGSVSSFVVQHANIPVTIVPARN